MGTRHTRYEIQEISDALLEIQKKYGSKVLIEMSLGQVAEELLAQGDRPAGSWIFDNRNDWYDFLRTGELVIRELQERPLGPKNPPKKVA